MGEELARSKRFARNARKSKQQSFQHSLEIDGKHGHFATSTIHLNSCVDNYDADQIYEYFPFVHSFTLYSGRYCQFTSEIPREITKAFLNGTDDMLSEMGVSNGDGTR